MKNIFVVPLLYILLAVPFILPVYDQADPWDHAQTFYFPHFIAGQGLETRITITNPSDAPARLTLSAFGDQGNLISVIETEIAAQSGLASGAAELFKLQENTPYSGWIRVATSNDRVQGFFSFDDNDMFPAVRQVGTEFTLSGVSNGAEAVTGIALANPSPDPASIAVTIFDSHLRLVEETSFIVPANGHALKLIHHLLQDIVLGGKPDEVSSYYHVEVRSDVGIVAFQSSFPSEKVVEPSGAAVASDLPGLISTIRVGKAPRGVAVNPRSNRAVVANTGSDNVSVLDLSSHQVIANIHDAHRPEGAAINPNTNIAVIANRERHDISLIDLTDNRLVATMAVGRHPVAVAVHPERNIAVVANRSAHNVSVVDLARRSVIATIGVGREPVSAAINPVTSVAAIANRASDNVSIIDLNTNRVVATVAVGEKPEGVAINSETNRAIVSSRNEDNNAEDSGILSVIDLATHRVVRTVRVGRHPLGLDVSTVTNTAVVADQEPAHVAALVDLSTNRVSAVVRVGRRPHGVAINPNSNVAIVSNTGDHSVSLIQLPFPVPEIVSLSTASITAGGDPFTLTVHGKKFFTPSLVKWNGTALATTFVNSQQLAATVPASLIAQAGTAQVTVVNPAPGGGTASPIIFTINNPVPTVTSISPISVSAGGSDFNLTINGTNFINGAGGNSVVRFGGTSLATVFVSRTQLTASVPASLILQAAVVSVTVFNSPPGGGTSNSVGFTIINPRPRITGMAPLSGPIGAALTITGENFSPVAGSNIVTFAGPNGTRIAATVSSSTATQILTTVPAGAVSGPVQVTINNFASNGFVFIVTVLQDYTLSITPATASVIQGSSVTYQVTANGTNNYAGVIDLSLSGVAAGATATFNPPSITAGQSATLTISTSSTAATGPAALTIYGQALLNGAQAVKTASAILNVQPAGVTALVGRVLNTDNAPIPGVRMTMGSQTTLTDGSGNFLIMDPPLGEQEVVADGRSASTPGVTYPVVPVVVTIVAGRVNEMGFIIYLPKIDTSTTTPIDPTRDTIITSPSIPGLEVIIPAGTTIRMPDGTPVSAVSVTAVPMDRAPMPPPANTKVSAGVLFTLQPGGAIPSRPIPIKFPNAMNLFPGEKANLYYFDHKIGDWRIYGTGTASSDGRQVVSDPGVGLPDFAWHFPDCPACPPPGVGPGGCGGGAPSGGGVPGAGAPVGDPVDAATGIFFRSSVDITLPGRLPAFIERRYRTQSSLPGPFGIGTAMNYDLLMLTTFAVNGGPAFLVDADGNRLRFDRQFDGSLTSADRPEYLGAKLTVNSDGNSVLRFKHGLVYSFDSSGRLIRISDRNSNALILVRDARGHLVRVIEPAGRSLIVTYDSSGRVVSIADPLGRTVTYTYNSTGTLSEFRDPAGNSTRYNYDANNRLVEIIDARGNLVVRNTYDAMDRVVRQEHGDGGAFTFNYMSVGGSVVGNTISLPDGGTSTLRFNGLGYMVELSNASCCSEGSQQTISQRASATNLVLSTTDALGRKTSFTYDNAGNITSVTDPAGNVTSFEYVSQSSNVTKVTDALGNVTSFDYDARGNLIRRVDPLGNSSLFEYDRFGQLISATDPLGNKAQFIYNDLGDLVRTIDPLGNVSQVNYDSISRPSSLSDFNGRTATLRYDPLSRVTEIQDPLGSKINFTYDANSNLLTATDHNGHAITNAYDIRNRLTRGTDQVGRAVSISYDPRDRVIGFADRKGQTDAHRYNTSDQRTRTTFADGSFIEYTYDAIGRIIRVNDSGSGTIEYSYDLVGNLTQEKTPQGTVSYDYDKLQRRTRMLVSGQADPVLYSYDAASRLTGIRQGADIVTFSYDASDRITSARVPNGVETIYAYDGAGRITNLTYRTESTTLETINYVYDSNGNRQATTSRAAMINTQPMSATYDAANRLLTFVDKSFTYDGNGNRTSVTDRQGVTNYAWNARDQLVAINGPNLTATFTYDAVGRRISKTVNGQTTRYLYDGLNIVQEFGADNASYLLGLNIDQLLSRTDRNGKLYYLSDALNSTILLTDSGGAVVARYFYDVFGTTTSDPPAAISLQPFQFTGREFDVATGLYYYRTRYYDPQVGRFLSEDPIGFNGGINFYAYVGGNPVNLMDPLGLSWSSALTSFATGFVAGAVGTVVVSAAVASGTVVGAVIAVAVVAYGSYQVGTAIYELLSGEEAYTRRPLSGEARIDLGAGLAGALAGGGLAARGPEICFGKRLRIAPFGNRTGNPKGELPHYHRSVPNPAKPGQSQSGQGIGRHRPWDTKSTDKSFLDRF
jgi:RHS repeat-associated protein